MAIDTRFQLKATFAIDLETELRISVQRTCIRHSGLQAPLNLLPKTPLFISPGSPTHEAFPHLEAP